MDHLENENTDMAFSFNMPYLTSDELEIALGGVGLIHLRRHF